MSSLVSPAVSPLAQGRLDEPLGLAVGLRPVGFGEPVTAGVWLSEQLVERLVEQLRDT